MTSKPVYIERQIIGSASTTGDVERLLRDQNCGDVRRLLATMVEGPDGFHLKRATPVVEW
jgi:hypothetical protein